VTAVHAPDVFSKARGKSVTVCVIDTGVDREHPDLEGAVKGGENTITLYPDHAQRSWDDDNGHGTHVSGTIAARDNDMGVVGVAPEARIFAVKALNSRGSGNFSSLAEGLRSCMAHGAQVVNMSIGYEDDSQVVRKAVQDALDAGLILVAAAGNEKGSVDYPAKIPGVLAVSALSTDHRLAYFSNRGPEVAFIAPGENVLSTYPGNRYAFMDGTSQATPHVAGVVALLLSAGVHHVSSHLKGDDMGLSQEAQGAGCIDAQKSLKGLFEQLTLN
jgi:subtilisin family serine protease